MVRILCIFSSGRRASLRCVSRVIPKNVRQADGPSTFSNASRIPKREHTFLIVSRLWAHTGDSGGPSVRKSSR